MTAEEPSGRMTRHNETGIAKSHDANEVRLPLQDDMFSLLAVRSRDFPRERVHGSNDLRRRLVR